MKRMVRLSALICLLVISGIVFASSLVMIPLSSHIYDEVEALFTLEGKNVFLTSKPWSEADVEHLIGVISPTTERAKALKARIEGELSHNVDYSAGASLAPKLYLHSNVDQFNSPETMVEYTMFDDPILDIYFGYHYKTNFALYGNASVGVMPSDTYTYKSGEFGYMNDTLCQGLYSSNVPFFPGAMSLLNFPSRAYLALGSEVFRFVAARDRISWGNGLMGNIAIGDTLPYHDYISATFTGSSWFNYQLLVDMYSPFSVLAKGNKNTNLDGLRFMLGHRFEFSLFKNRLTFAFSDLIMYYTGGSDYFYINPTILLPTMFLHNVYIAGYSNSLDTLELTYTPFKGLTIYGQFGLDEIAGSGEPIPPSSGAFPNAYGFALGLKYRRSISNDSLLYVNCEAVYTSPFLYHRGTGWGGFVTDVNGSGSDPCSYNMGYISSLRCFSNGTDGIIRYLSYSFGSDAIAAEVNVGYKRLGLFDLSGDIFLMTHGIIDKWSHVDHYDSSNEGEDVSTPSTSNPFDGETGVPEYRLVLGLNGSYEPLSFLSLSAGVDFITIWNMNNESAPAAFDIQLTIGAKLSYGN